MADTISVPPWRVDVILATGSLALGGLAYTVASYPPLFGLQNMLGVGAEELARALLDALGVGLLVLFFGASALLLHYATRGSYWRFAMRCVGWAVLSATVAGLADLGNLFSQWPLSAYGPGGAIGAFIRQQLEARLRDPLPVIALLVLGLAGLTLAMDGFMRQFAWLLLTASHSASTKTAAKAANLHQWWQEQREARRQALQNRKQQPPVAATEEVTLRLALPSESDDPPIIRHPLPTPSVSDDTGIHELPIQRKPPVAPSLKLHAAETEDDESGATDYELPTLALLAEPDSFPVEDHETKLRERASLLEKTFTDFGLVVKVVGIHTGPVITQYEVSLDTGLRLNKVTTLSDDLALNLGVSSVRIVAPLPGRNTVGIEVPNDHRQSVRLKELIHATGLKASKFKLPIFLGKDVEGNPLAYDMATMPHLLIAGRTGTGKSVCLNAVILSLLFSRRPDECRMILIDPKKVELSEYGKIPHLMHPVVTDDKKAEAILAWAVDKMEERYELLRRARVRNIHSYNELGWAEIIRRIDPASEEERQALPRQMPYIVIVVDEVGDLLMSMKKEVESSIIRLAQKSRAAGIHLILATQKPTVDVITGLIKSNLPARICFQVASRADSAVVLDEKGAEKLLGQGDMLFLQPGTSSIIRAQGAYVDDREIERVVAALEVNEPNYESELLNLKTKDQAGGSLGEKLRERDPLYEQAVEVVIREQRGSTSLLQRALGIGYGKASRFIDFMFEDGVVGAYNGSNARDVLISPEEWESRRAAM